MNNAVDIIIAIIGIFLLIVTAYLAHFAPVWITAGVANSGLFLTVRNIYHFATKDNCITETN